MPLRGEHHGRRASRVSEQRGTSRVGRACRHPIRHNLGVGGGALGGEPSGRVALRGAVAALVQRVHGVPLRDERIHHGHLLPRHMEIEVRQRAPGAAVQQHDLALGNTGRSFFPEHETMTVVGADFSAQQRGRALRGHRSRRHGKQPRGDDEKTEWSRHAQEYAKTPRAPQICRAITSAAKEGNRQ